MRTYGADFGVSRHFHAFAGHRHQLAFPANAIKVSQLMGTRAEWARFGEGGERNHFRRIGIAQFDYWRGWGQRLRRESGFLPDHLQQRRSGDNAPASAWLILRVEEKSDCALGSSQFRERLITFVVRFEKRRQGADVGHKSPRSFNRLRKLDLPRSESLPDDVVERMHKWRCFFFEGGDAPRDTLIFVSVLGYPILAGKGKKRQFTLSDRHAAHREWDGRGAPPEIRSWALTCSSQKRLQPCVPWILPNRQS